MKLENLVNLAGYFSNREDVDFAVMLRSDEEILLAVNLSKDPEGGEAVERAIADDIRRIKGFSDRLKVVILNIRHRSLVKYVLKNGVPVFCRNDVVLADWYKKFFVDRKDGAREAGFSVAGMGLSSGYL